MWSQASNGIAKQAWRSQSLCRMSFAIFESNRHGNMTRGITERPVKERCDLATVSEKPFLHNNHSSWLLWKAEESVEGMTCYMYEAGTDLVLSLSMKTIPGQNGECTSEDV